MTRLTIEQAREYVAKGAERLEKYFLTEGHRKPRKPFWWQTIDKQKLDQSSAFDCTLGQPFDTYDKGLEKLGIETIDEASEHGYTLSKEHASSMYVRDNWKILTEAWLEYLVERDRANDERRDMSWARQYARNGARAMDLYHDEWFTFDPEFLHPHNDPALMARIRVIARRINPQWYDSIKENDNESIALGFYPGTQANENQLRQAWAEQIDRRNAMQELVEEIGISEVEQIRADWDNDMGDIEDDITSTTLYIVLNGPFSVGLVTENKEEAESWVSAISSVGEECALVEKKVGNA